MKPLSKYNPIFKICPHVLPIILGIGILLWFFWSVDELRMFFSYVLVFCLVIVVITFYKIRLIYLESYQIFFDSESLIFKNKVSKKESYNSNLVVSYTDISSINQVPSQFKILGFSFSNYNVVFDKEGRGKDVQNFHVLSWSQEFNQFKRMAETANPYLIIRRKDYNFDNFHDHDL